MVNLMTPDQYSTMKQVSIPKETSTPQAATPLDKDLTSGAQFKQTDTKLLSADDDVQRPQVSTQEKNLDVLLSSEKKDPCNEHSVTEDSLSTSCSINPISTVVSAELKGSSELKGQKFLIAGEDSLLYSEVLDEEDGSIDLDSSLEGKLLVIDESMSDEESDSATETVEPVTSILPKVDKTTSSPTQHHKINKDLEMVNDVAPTFPLTDKIASSPTEDKEINKILGTVELQAQTTPQIDEQATSTTPLEDIKTVELVVPTVPQIEKSASTSTQYEKINKDPEMAVTVPQIGKPAFSSTHEKDTTKDLETVVPDPLTAPQIAKPVSSVTKHKETTLEKVDMLAPAVLQRDKPVASSTPNEEIEIKFGTVKLELSSYPPISKLSSSPMPHKVIIENLKRKITPLITEAPKLCIKEQRTPTDLQIDELAPYSTPDKKTIKSETSCSKIDISTSSPKTQQEIYKDIKRETIASKTETSKLCCKEQNGEPASSPTPNGEMKLNLETIKLESTSSLKTRQEMNKDLKTETIALKTDMPKLCYQEQKAQTVLQIGEPPSSSTPQKEMDINIKKVKLDASSCSQITETTPSPTPNKEIEKDLERTNVASETVAPKLFCQKLSKDSDMRNKLSNIESSKPHAVAKGKDDTSKGNTPQRSTKCPILLKETCEMEQKWKIKEDQLKSNNQLSKQGDINLVKFLNRNQHVVFKEALKNRLDRSDDMAAKVIPNNKDGIKDKTTELASIREHSNQNKVNDSSRKSHGTPVQPSASPDSTTSTCEELSPKWVSCRKVSFVLIENRYVCLSCCKRFTTELLFKRHVWGHFHGCESRPQLCNQCTPKQYFSPCPAVNKVFSMLRNSCSKDVSSLRLNLSLNIPPKEKVVTDKSQAALTENPLKNTLHPLTNEPSTLTNNPDPLPKQSQIVRQTSEQTSSRLRGGHSENLEYLTIFIASQQLMCTKCRKCIEPSHLAEHIYRHLHTSTTIPKHGICISEKNCDIMGRIVPLIPDIEIRKAGFHLLDISWKRTIQSDFKFQIMLIRHNRKRGPTNQPLMSSKEDLQVLKASSFIIPNKKEECVAAESDAKDTVISEKEKVIDDNVVFLEKFQSKRTTRSSAKTDGDGYKKMIFVIKGNDHICTSCKKAYVTLDSLKSHIMWHFHSEEKLCSISHYDVQRSHEDECPILANIMNCIPKDPKWDNEMKRVIVNWKKNSAERTAFKVQIHYPRNIIDLTNSDDDDMSEQSKKESLKKEMIIDLSEHTVFPTETIKPVQNETEKPKPENIPSAAINSQESHSCKSVRSEIVNNPSQKSSEGGFYICGFPGCKFSSIESKKFLDHFEELHSHEKIFPCIHCGFHANGQDLLMEHMETHVNHTLFLLYRCSMCEYATNLLPDFEKHLRSCHSENGRYICCSCREFFRVIDLLLKHLSKNLLKFILCPHCSARDIYRHRMLDHIKTHHPDKPRQIIVSSQIICKSIIQNKLLGKDPKLKEALMRRSKNKENVVIVLDDEEEDCNTSKEGKEVVKATNGVSQSGLLVNLLNKVETKPKPLLDNLIADGKKTDGGSKSKNGEASLKHSNTNLKENENSNATVINDHINVSNNCDEDVVQKRPKHQSRILSKMLLNNETEKVKTDDGSYDVESKVPKSKSSVVKKGDEEEKRKKNLKEHYTVKDISKFPCELKVRLRRLSSSKEACEPKRLSPNPTSASAKERNVFKLFGEIDKPNVEESQIPVSTGDEVQNAVSSENEEQFPVSSGCEPEVAESSRDAAEMTSSEGQNSFKGNKSDREDIVENNSTDTEDMSDPKTKKPSLRQEVSLGGATLDLRLQKCYSKGGKNNKDKQLVCDVCQEVFKTAYRIHLHLLSEHLEWPLWECQDCGTRAYSHSKMTSHCWRHHKKQLPRIISLDMPVIERKDNNIVIHNSQEEFADPVGTSPISGKKNVKSMILMPSRFKKGANSVSSCASSAEPPKQSAKITRKRSISTNSEDGEQNKKRSKSSANENVPDTTNSISIVCAGKSALVGHHAPVASPKRDSPNDRGQPPRKKSKSCEPDRNEQKCSMCDYRCCSKSSLDLLQHMIQEHMKEFQNFIREEEIEQVEDAITGNPLTGFVCPFCGQKTEQRVSCKIHIWRTHGHLEYLHCDLCKFVTWFERHLQRHMADEHAESLVNGASKDEETPATSVNQSNNHAVTSSAVTSSTIPLIQQNDNAEKTTGQKKQIHCNRCKYTTFSKEDLKVHSRKHNPKKKAKGIVEKKNSTKSTNPNSSSASLPPKKALSSGVNSKKPKKSPMVSLPLQKSSDKTKKDNKKNASTDGNKKNLKKNCPVLQPVLKASHSDRNNRDRRRSPPVLPRIENRPPSDKNNKRNPPLLYPMPMVLSKDENRIIKGKTAPQLSAPFLKDSSLDESSNKDQTLKQTPPTLLPLQKAPCTYDDKPSKTPPVLFLLLQPSSRDEGTNREKAFPKETPPVSPPTRGILSSDESNKKDRPPSKPSDKSEKSSEKCPEEESQKSSDENKNSRKDKISEDKVATAKSLETNKNSPFYRKILPKPPFALEKISGASPSPKPSGASPSPKPSGASPKPSGASPSPKPLGASLRPKPSGPSPKSSGASPSPKPSGAIPSLKSSGAIPSPKSSGAIPSPKSSGAIPSPKSSGAIPSPKSSGAIPSPKSSGTNQNQKLSGTKFPEHTPKSNVAAIGGKESTVRSQGNSNSEFVMSVCPKTRKRLYICSICSAVRYSIYDVLNHCKKHRDVLYSCSECSYQKHNRDRVFEHLKLAHRNEGRVHSTSGNSLKGRLKLEEEKKKKK